MIQDVLVKDLAVIPDERGRLMEILRCDDPEFKEFGQVYMTTTLPNVVKAWHMHEKQWDHICCVYGMIKLVLFDERDDSKTKDKTEEYVLGTHGPKLVIVPPFVWHGWKCISVEEALIVNTVTRPYSRLEPDEKRLDAHKSHIKYKWERKDG